MRCGPPAIACTASRAGSACPAADEEAPPAFQHFGVADLPEREDKGVTLRLIAGEALRPDSRRCKTFSPIFYADARFAPGGALHYDAEHEERAFLVIEGEVQTGDDAKCTVPAPCWRWSRAKRSRSMPTPRRG